MERQHVAPAVLRKRRFNGDRGRVAIKDKALRAKRAKLISPKARQVGQEVDPGPSLSIEALNAFPALACRLHELPDLRRGERATPVANVHGCVEPF
jgi:hypothetical protein